MGTSPSILWVGEQKHSFHWKGIYSSWDTTSEKEKIDIAKLKQEEYYNKYAHLFQVLSVGETVRVKTQTRPWKKVTIIGTNKETRSYKVKTEEIADNIRNRKHLSKSIEGPKPYHYLLNKYWHSHFLQINFDIYWQCTDNVLT